ncbi:MAG: protein kinase [Anaerolineales bacterium]|nr:protein kinase [Anaerolineales bacterium]
MPLTSGQVINNRYRISALLGQGGAGAVYKAWDVTLNTPVALKEYRAASIQAAQQFSLQARLLANLRHENLPYVIDHFDLPDGGQCLVMELVEGQDLQSLINKARGGLPEAQALACIHKVCDALSYLHSQSPPIIHRDVKPANIKITPKGQVIVVDFGFPKGGEPVAGDTHSDIYALGATLYTLLTGRAAPNIHQRQAGQRVPPPRQINPAITPPVEAAILRAMESAPEAGFHSVDEFKQALPPPPALSMAYMTRDSGSPAPAHPGSAASSGRAASSNWVIWAVIALAVLCLGVVIIGGVGAYLYMLPKTEASATTAVGLELAATATALASQLAIQVSTVPAQEIFSTPTPTLPAPPPLDTSTSTPTPTSTLPGPSTATMTSSPTTTPTTPSAPQSTWQPCPGIYFSRLHVGDKAMVSEDPPLPNRVRTQPNTDGAILGFIQPGERVEIIEGPICSNQWVWWRVRSLKTGLTGWTAEGDANGYWLVPLP